MIALTLPANTSAPRVARDTLRAFGASSPDAAVVVSELVANALLHGALPITLTVERTGAILRIAVRDERGDFGTPSDRSLGLQIVRSLALAWGIEPIEGNGKMVWADIAA